MKKLRAGYSMCVIARNEGVSKNAIYTRVEAICRKLGKDRDTFFAELPKQKTYTIMDIFLRLERLEELIRQLVKE